MALRVVAVAVVVVKMITDGNGIEVGIGARIDHRTIDGNGAENAARSGDMKTRIVHVAVTEWNGRNL
jgi:hypothetical protein